MAIFEPITKKFLCECGCGEECSAWSNYKLGHNLITRDSQRKAAKARTGLSRSEAAKRAISEGMQQAYWEDPTLRERAGGSCSGRFLSRKHKDNISRSREEFWSSSEGWKLRERYSLEKWKGTCTGRYGYGWEAVRELILIRDNFTCQGCGRRGDFRSLQAHHIEEGTYGEEHNLITVCPSCNQRAASKCKEDYWRGFYRERIKEIYRELLEESR